MAEGRGEATNWQSKFAKKPHLSLVEVRVETSSTHSNPTIQKTKKVQTLPNLHLLLIILVLII